MIELKNDIIFLIKSALSFHLRCYTWVIEQLVILINPYSAFFVNYGDQRGFSI